MHDVCCPADAVCHGMPTEMTSGLDTLSPQRAFPTPVAAAVTVAVVAAGCATLASRGAVGWAFGVGAAGTLVVALLAMRLTFGLHVANALAVRDALTGLPNRVLLSDRIEQALQRSRRNGEPFALFAVDLDGFKEVNDIRGHEAGNQVLVSIARRLESIVRASDTVARVGGDEFVILSLGTGSDDEAAILVGRMRTVLRRPYKADGTMVEVDASIGWAIFPGDGATPAELLGRADGQMYATKRDVATVDSAGRRTYLDAGIVREYESALERDELIVHYQPVLELPSGAVRSVEALVRRIHPTLGLVLPGEFIPHVERTPVIRALTLRVLAQALRDAADWRGRGHPVGVSVNVPYRILDDPDFAAGVAGLLESGLETPVELTFEVVPSGPGAGVELDRLALERLVRLGVRLSLDDFGRASSFVALTKLPLQEVKIDAAFVHGLGRSRHDDAIVRSLVHLAHELGLIAVAEGVETQAAWDASLTVGCDRAQGFYVLPPLPGHELTVWLESSWPAVSAQTG